MPQELCDIGLIGLAVMGQNLVLNMNDHGFTVAVFNRTVSKVDDFLNNEAKGRTIAGAHSIEELTRLLKRPRRVMLMVKAGETVDHMIDQLVPHLEHGDIIIDGGNSHFPDTTRRTEALAEKGILFIGTGVSGGEEGARHGPSIMPGGNPLAWPHVKEIFQAIAAKVRWRALLRVGRRGRRRPLREDGPQRHRIRRHAADLRGLPDAEGRAGPDGGRTARRLRGVEQGRTGQLPDRDHARHLRQARTRTARRSSTRSSTRPARRARASGPASARSTWACR